ncbi:MAG: hypothetical protein JWM59_1293 [Verrucomicrobiales bacterium]|nr:hypothetical protein [Verrucomicrobiales bacterium]
MGLLRQNPMVKMTFALPKTLKAAIAEAAAAEGRDPSSYTRYTMAKQLGITLPVKALWRAKIKSARPTGKGKEAA